MSEHIETEDDAIRFVRRVKFALRYNSTPALPLASMYGAARDQRTAIELTNALLARAEVIETNVIADRLVLVHRTLFLRFSLCGSDSGPAIFRKMRKKHFN